MWAVPFGFGLTLFCSDLVHFGIGEKWRPAIILLQIFGAAAALNHVGFNWDAYFRARGETRPMAVASVAAATVFLASAVPLVLTHGLTGLAVAVALQGAAHMACRAYYLRRLFKGFGFALHALRAVLPTIPAAAAVLLMRVAETGPRMVEIAIIELSAYLAIAAAATWLLEGRLLREATGYLLARRPAGVAG
jgi:O-antigen/teichoic acid export membrane protein